MNVTQLKEAVDLALSRGLHPDTEVVVAHDGWYHLLDDGVLDPSEPGRRGTDRELMWFTLNPRLEDAHDGRDPGRVWTSADSRFTPGHEVVPSPPVWEAYIDHVHAQEMDGGRAMDYVDWVRAQVDIEAEIAESHASDDYEGRAAQYRWVSALAHEAERYA